MKVYVLFCVSRFEKTLMAIYSNREEAEKESNYWTKVETNPEFSYLVEEIKVYDFYGEEDLD